MRRPRNTTFVAGVVSEKFGPTLQSDKAKDGCYRYRV
jgi:hypothetical protein